MVSHKIKHLFVCLSPAKSLDVLIYDHPFLDPSIGTLRVNLLSLFLVYKKGPVPIYGKHSLCRFAFILNPYPCSLKP